LITILPSSFSFYTCLLLLFLHSFPTRRSSDLAGHHQVDRRHRIRGVAHVSLEQGIRFDQAIVRGLVADRVDLEVGVEVGDRVVADRKSTRLNSSHDQISYAVFCLKKKNSGIVM